ncbi:MAG: type II secretion system protein GspG [Verrucomicrobia bacterium]|nr:type II secretion system protein GspG [Verrucomicrobiota bacterium]
MALFECSECGKDVSTRAGVCPFCGCPRGGHSLSPQTSTLAIWSLVLGILSLTALPILAAIPAIICGNKAHSRINGSAGALAGRGLANAGLVTGYLSISLALIGMIAGMVLLGFQAASAANRAGRLERQIAATQTRIATFKTALDAYEVDNGYYPKGKNGLVDLIQQPRDAQNWRGPYLQDNAVPKDPWGNDYIYECPGWHNPTSYDVSSQGPPGSNMVIGNWTSGR